MIPKVTLVCNAYNHKNYIAQAIESFANQRTNFEYEIVIHDDCSTDGTKEIIEEYAKKYPDLIRPIYEEENQTSKGKKVTTDIVLPTIRSKYMCFCEGDDFLVSTEKLQKQYDYMESHPNCTLCTHAIKTVDKLGNDCGKRVGKEGNYKTIDVLSETAPYIHTSSMFFRTEDFKKMPKEVFVGYTIGDLMNRLYLTNLGHAHYFSEIMSAYRLFSENSWSSRISKDSSYAIKNMQSGIDFYKKFDEYTSYKYTEIVSKNIDKRIYKYSYFVHNYKNAKKTEYYRIAPTKQKLKINLGIIFPFVFKVFKKQSNLIIKEKNIV